MLQAQQRGPLPRFGHRGLEPVVPVRPVVGDLGDGNGLEDERLTAPVSDPAHDDPGPGLERVVMCLPSGTRTKSDALPAASSCHSRTDKLDNKEDEQCHHGQPSHSEESEHRLLPYRCGDVIAKPDPGAKVVTVGGIALSWSIVAHAGHCA